MPDSAAAQSGELRGHTRHREGPAGRAAGHGVRHVVPPDHPGRELHVRPALRILREIPGPQIRIPRHEPQIRCPRGCEVGRHRPRPLENHHMPHRQRRFGDGRAQRPFVRHLDGLLAAGRSGHGHALRPGRRERRHVHRRKRGNELRRTRHDDEQEIGRHGADGHIERHARHRPRL